MPDDLPDIPDGETPAKAGGVNDGTRYNNGRKRHSPLKAVIWNSEFDIGVARALRMLKESDINIDLGHPEEYVLATFYERMEALRKSSAIYGRAGNDIREEIELLNRELRTIKFGRDTEEVKEEKSNCVKATIHKLATKLADYDEKQAALSKHISTSGFDIIKVCRGMEGDEAVKGNRKPKGPVRTNSWNPDEPPAP